MFVSKIYSTIEDCLSLNWSGFITSQYATVTVVDNILSFSNEGAYRGAYIFNEKMNAPYMIELTYIEISGNFTFGLGFVKDNYTGTDANKFLEGYYSKRGLNYWSSLYYQKFDNVKPVTGDVYRLEVYDTHVNTYKNDSLILVSQTVTDALSNSRFAIIGTDSPYKQSWKNIKIKKL